MSEKFIVTRTKVCLFCGKKTGMLKSFSLRDQSEDNIFKASKKLHINKKLLTKSSDKAHLICIDCMQMIKSSKTFIQEINKKRLSLQNNDNKEEQHRKIPVKCCICNKYCYSHFKLIQSKFILENNILIKETFNIDIKSLEESDRYACDKCYNNLIQFVHIHKTIYLLHPHIETLFNTNYIIEDDIPTPKIDFALPGPSKKINELSNVPINTSSFDFKVEAKSSTVNILAESDESKQVTDVIYFRSCSDIASEILIRSNSCPAEIMNCSNYRQFAPSIADLQSSSSSCHFQRFTPKEENIFESLVTMYPASDYAAINFNVLNSSKTETSPKRSIKKPEKVIKAKDTKITVALNYRENDSSIEIQRIDLSGGTNYIHTRVRQSCMVRFTQFWRRIFKK